MIKSFENVKSEKTSSGYINVPKNMGLITFIDGRCELTEAGELYLGSKDLTYLYETISKNILAFDDVYQFLKTAKEPQNVEQILEYLKENFEIEWTTYAQVNFRLFWLQNLKMIKNTDQGYTA